MVRRCIVPGCRSNDQQILSHRFPRKPEYTARWAASLGVDNVDSESLRYTFTVCCLHFEASAYRNAKSNLLNVTAVPTLKPINPRVNSNEAIKFRSCSKNAFENICDEPFCSTTNIKSLESDTTNESNNVICYENTNLPDSTDSTTTEATTEGKQLPDFFINFQEDMLDEPLGNYFQADSERAEEQDMLENIISEKNQSTGQLNKGSNYATLEDDIEDIVLVEESDLSDAVDAITQVSSDDLGRACENDEYSELTRQELVELLKAQQQIIKEQREKLEAFQNAHADLLDSMETFKNIVGTS